ncbi:PAS domain S-box protein [Larkinella arboricola]
MPELLPETLLPIYQTVMDSMNQGFCLLEKVPTPPNAPSDFRYLLTNPAFEEQSGLGQVVGKTIRQLVPGAQEHIMAHYDQAALTGQPVHFQDYVDSLDFWIEAHAFRLEGYDLPRIAVLFTNITERKKSQEALHYNHLWLTQAMRSARAGWARWDLVSGQMEWSPEGKAIVGFSSQEEAQTLEGWLGRIHPDDRPNVQARAAESIAQRKEFEYEYRVVHDDGQVRWLQGTGQVFYNQSGRPYHSAGLVIDITQRKQVEQALRQSEEQYRLLFSSIEEGFCLIQVQFNEWGQVEDYRLLEVNPSFEKLTGIYQGTGRWIRDIVPTFPQNFLDMFGQVVLTGERCRFEVQSKSMDRWYDIYGFRVGQASEQKVGLLFNDITQRKRQQDHQDLLADITEAITDQVGTQEIMAIAGQKLMAVFPISSFSIWDIRPDSDEVYRRFFWAKDPLLLPERAHLSAYFSPDGVGRLRQGENVVIRDIQTDLGANAEAFKALDIGSYVGLPYRREEHWKSILTLFSPIAYDWQPDQIALLTDVMNRLLPRIERARAEEALKASQARLTALFESLPVGVGEADTNGRLVLANRQMQRFLPNGLIPSQDRARQDRWRAYHPDGRRLEPEEYPAARALRGERVVPGLEMLYTPDEGPPIWIRMAAVPIREDEGRATGIVAIITDISELKQAEEALKEASRRKDEFLAMLAHELRNPLASIRLGMGLLSWTDETDPLQQQTVRLINQQVDHLVRLVDELLDVSRISRGKIQLKLEAVELTGLIASSVAAIRPQYEALGKGLHFTPWEKPLLVQGDATRLGQVVTNLLTNGLRYTGEQGQVWVSLQEKDGQGHLRVADNGIGLTPDQQTAIFELFVQVDVSLARSEGGLGIGLTLVKRLVEMHGGRVQAHSPGLGQGSEFVICLPLLEQSPKALTPIAAPLDAKVVHQRILVIDDNVGLALLLAQTLKQSGYEVPSRHSGREGIQAAEVLHPTAILCDIGMPELDGYETCRLIRQQPWGQDVVMIAVTGYGGEEDKRRAREAGFDHHLVKPLDMKLLTQLLNQHSIHK